MALCCLAALVEGFDIQSMGVAAPTLAPALGLARSQLGPVFSASTLGLLIGALVVGRLADRIGRRAALISSLLVFGVFSLATASAWNYPSLLTMRLLAGLGLGGAMPNIIALAAEAGAERSRARLVALAAAALPFGGAVASLTATFLGWRAIFMVGGAAPLAVSALMGPLLPESYDLIAARSQGGRLARTAYAEALFGSGRAAPTALLWIAAGMTLLTLFLLLNWLPTLMAAKGAPRAEAELISGLFNIGGGLGALALAVLFRGERRAGVIAAWFAGMVVALVLLAASRADLATAGAAALAAGAFVSSTPTAIYAIAPDFYAVEIRGAGLGATIGVGRVGAILGPLLAGAVLEAGGGPAAALLALLPIIAVAAAATFGLLLIRGGAGRIARTAASGAS